MWTCGKWGLISFYVAYNFDMYKYNMEIHLSNVYCGLKL